MKMWDKYLVLRRDGSVPDWPYLVLGARDPDVPAAIRALASTAEGNGRDPEYVADLLALADSFEAYRRRYGDGDPDAPPHRPDDPAVVARIKAGSTPDGWRTREQL